VNVILICYCQFQIFVPYRFLLTLHYDIVPYLYFIAFYYLYIMTLSRILLTRSNHQR
jgi:hypothetical protein